MCYTTHLLTPGHKIHNSMRLPKWLIANRSDGTEKIEKHEKTLKIIFKAGTDKIMDPKSMKSVKR